MRKLSIVLLSILVLGALADRCHDGCVKHYEARLQMYKVDISKACTERCKNATKSVAEYIRRVNEIKEKKTELGFSIAEYVARLQTKEKKTQLGLTGAQQIERLIKKRNAKNYFANRYFNGKPKETKKASLGFIKKAFKTVARGFVTAAPHAARFGIQPVKKAALGVVSAKITNLTPEQKVAREEIRAAKKAALGVVSAKITNLTPEQKVAREEIRAAKKAALGVVSAKITNLTPEQKVAREEIRAAKKAALGFFRSIPKFFAGIAAKKELKSTGPKIAKKASKIAKLTPEQRAAKKASKKAALGFFHALIAKKVAGFAVKKIASKIGKKVLKSTGPKIAKLTLEKRVAREESRAANKASEIAKKASKISKLTPEQRVATEESRAANKASKIAKLTPVKRVATEEIRAAKKASKKAALGFFHALIAKKVAGFAVKKIASKVAQKITKRRV